FLLMRRSPCSTLFPYTTLFRSVAFGWRVWQRGRLFRWSERLRIWSMTDVVVIAGVIAYIRADISADVEVRVGAWCYVAVALLTRSEEHTSELQSLRHLVCRLLL